VYGASSSVRPATALREALIALARRQTALREDTSRGVNSVAMRWPMERRSTAVRRRRHAATLVTAADRSIDTLGSTRRLSDAMLVLLFLIVWPAIEIFALIEVGHAIGWPLAIVVLLGTSVLGAQLLRVQGRTAIERVSVAVSEHRAPARAAVDGLLGFLGGVLLVIPGFVTDALGALLLLPPTRALTRRWLSRHYAGRAMRFVATTGRFASRDRGRHPDDVESTAVDDDRRGLGR